MRLTKSQKEFIEHHGIDEEQVFDASRYKQSTYRSIMKDEGFIVAFGVTKCSQGHDSLRTRSGHCVMCNPASLSFQKRHKSEGDLYVMLSPKTKLVKVGVAESAKERLISLNKQAYGDIKDWKLVHVVRVTNAGYAEEVIHGRLQFHAVERYFYKGGEMVLSKEIFSCSAQDAINEINSLIKS